jgi:hypothetical protein
MDMILQLISRRYNIVLKPKYSTNNNYNALPLLLHHHSPPPTHPYRHTMTCGSISHALYRLLMRKFENSERQISYYYLFDVKYKVTS